MIAELTIIIPTLNERDNIIPLVERITAVLQGVDWEILFVDDDSSDGTRDVLHQLARQNERVRYIRRVGRHGLSSACLEGMAASTSPYLAVMDADMQHDESLLPKMLEILRSGNTDIVIGSRHKDKETDTGRSFVRRLITRIGIWLAHRMLNIPISDPLSGFFMLKRPLFERTIYKVSGGGFKVLLDIFVAAGKDIRHEELPFIFRKRHAGESKLDTLVIWEYALLLFDKTVGKIIPTRFFMFVCVGLLGLLLHLSILWFCMYILSMTFWIGQTSATATTIMLNFLLNNMFTYRDMRLTGTALIRGVVFFYLTCSLGAGVNILVAEFLFEQYIPWWLAGLLGALIGGVWNYAVSSVLVWSWKKHV